MLKSQYFTEPFNNILKEKSQEVFIKEMQNISSIIEDAKQSKNNLKLVFSERNVIIVKAYSIRSIARLKKVKKFGNSIPSKKGIKVEFAVSLIDFEERYKNFHNNFL